MSNDSTAVPSSPLEGPQLDTDAAATRRSGTEALDPAALEEIAVDVAVAAAGLVRRRLRRYYRSTHMQRKALRRGLSHR